MVAERPRAARASVLGTILVLAAGCDDVAHAPDAGVDVAHRRPPSPAPPPPGLGAPTRPVFSLDTAQREHRFAIQGDAGHVLVATLVDAVGRRSIRYARADGTESVLLAEGAWNLPPTGAVVMGGDTAVCWNVLTGSPSRFTAGSVPEPAQGMLLLCRVGAGTRWGPAVSLDAPTTGVWVERVVARQDGAFSVHYIGDDGWLAAPASAGHGVYETIVRDGRFETPRLVLAAGDGT